MLPLATFRSHWRLLAFGFLMTFCSSFGQTYFISIFGGILRDVYGLSHTAYGTCYSAGTIASAMVLMWAGRFIDRRSLVTFSVAALAGLATACLLMATTSGVALLCLTFFALRFFGQGLVTHAAMTAMGRYFAAERGRAISFAALGYVTGEAVLPLTTVMLMAILHWRTIWGLGVGFLAIAAIPIVIGLLSRAPSGPPATVSTTGTADPRRTFVGRDASLAEVLRELRFYLVLPVMLAPSFISTGLIFHQVHIGVEKGWSLTLIASSLSVFAGGSLVMMIIAGWLVDRFSAARLLPVCLTPLAAACVMLACGSSPAAALAFFGLLGVGSGLTAVIFGSIWAELYGVRELGAIRAFGASAMVFSSGLAPAAMGLMFDAGWSTFAITIGCAIYCVAASFCAVASHHLESSRDVSVT